MCGLWATEYIPGFYLFINSTYFDFYLSFDESASFRPEVFNPAPGDPLSWKVYFQPASAHLPAIFKQSWGAWLAASGVFD